MANNSISLQSACRAATSPSGLLFCPRCHGSIATPDLSESEKLALANLARSKTITEVILRLKRQVHFTLTDAKFLALHTTRTKGVCHRCYYPLEVPGESECPNCQALNLDW